MKFVVEADARRACGRAVHALAVVTKVRALLVAMYSWLILSGLECYGPSRTRDYLPLPQWRKGAKRASCLDMVTLLRQQLAKKPTLFTTGTSPPTSQTMLDAAAA